MVGDPQVSPDGITQAEEMFIALKQRGVDTVMVRYPGEGHGIRQPKHIVDMHRRVLNWFDHYVKGEGTTSSR